MKVGVFVALGLVLFAVIGFGMWVMWKMNVSKGEIGLSVRMEAQEKVVETSLFKMRSAIKNIHNCTTEWADNFIKVVAQQAAGRGGNKVAVPENNAVVGVAAVGAGTALQIGRESEALGIPQDLYLKLANAIEGQLADFTRQQDTLNDVWREHKAYCKDPYHNWLGVSLAGNVKPQPEMITSAETKEAVKTKVMEEKMF